MGFVKVGIFHELYLNNCLNLDEKGGSVKLKIYDLNQKNFLKLSIEHNRKVKYIYYFILKLTEPKSIIILFLNSHIYYNYHLVISN
jgi:hypothetical protein